MKNTLLIILIFSLLVIGAGIVGQRHYVYFGKLLSDAASQTAAAFFIETISVGDLQKQYIRAQNSKNKIRVLVVPGHEPNYGGTEYGLLKERDVVLELSEYLNSYIGKNRRYEVIVARDRNGWNPVLQSYFENNWNEINQFKDNSKDEMVRLILEGKIKLHHDNAYHNNAPSAVATRLFGINKWANENAVDVVLHLHFNDYARTDRWSAGVFSGFSIYIPEKQYSNSETSRAIAEPMFKRLANFFPVSSAPKESVGIVEEQELVAIGQGNTVDAPSLLIEYGYIYEPYLEHPYVRSLMLREMALQTYFGLQDFFGGQNDTGHTRITSLLPYEWKEIVWKDTMWSPDVLSLQAALRFEGLYPPAETNLHGCPISGNFGECTAIALTNFQAKYGIQEPNYIGPKTREKLNELYGK
jgi:N-acetylmuramoyl-L-alanine amidase